MKLKKSKSIVVFETGPGLETGLKTYFAESQSYLGFSNRSLCPEPAGRAQNLRHFRSVVGEERD